MTAKHTPGPWAHHNTPTPFIYVNAGGLPICQIYTSTAHGQSMGEQFANAHLIAAAPELLEALKACAAVCAGETMNKRGLISALEQARAALAKCQGEKE